MKKEIENIQNTTLAPFVESLNIEIPKQKIIFNDFKLFPNDKKLNFDTPFELLTNFIDPQFDSLHMLQIGDSIDDLSDPSSFDLLNL